MTSQDMASQELAKWRNEVAKDSLKTVVISDEQSTLALIRKTHKGLHVIETKKSSDEPEIFNSVVLPLPRSLDKKHDRSKEDGPKTSESLQAEPIDMHSDNEEDSDLPAIPSFDQIHSDSEEEEAAESIPASPLPHLALTPPLDAVAGDATPPVSVDPEFILEVNDSYPTKSRSSYLFNSPISPVSPMSPSSPVFGSFKKTFEPLATRRVVWEGYFSRGTEEFSVSCVQYGGPALPKLPFPSNLRPDGRVRHQAIAEYVPQVTMAFSRRRVVVLGFHAQALPGDDVAKNQHSYNEFINFYKVCDRGAVFDREKKDGYLMYVLPPDPSALLSNEVLQPLLHCARPEGVLWGLCFLDAEIFDQCCESEPYVPRLPLPDVVPRSPATASPAPPLSLSSPTSSPPPTLSRSSSSPSPSSSPPPSLSRSSSFASPPAASPSPASASSFSTSSPPPAPTSVPPPILVDPRLRLSQPNTSSSPLAPLPASNPSSPVSTIVTSPAPAASASVTASVASAPAPSSLVDTIAALQKALASPLSSPPPSLDFEKAMFQPPPHPHPISHSPFPLADPMSQGVAPFPAPMPLHMGPIPPPEASHFNCPPFPAPAPFHGAPPPHMVPVHPSAPLHPGLGPMHPPPEPDHFDMNARGINMVDQFDYRQPRPQQHFPPHGGPPMPQPPPQFRSHSGFEPEFNAHRERGHDHGHQGRHDYDRSHDRGFSNQRRNEHARDFDHPRDHEFTNRDDFEYSNQEKEFHGSEYQDGSEFHEGSHGQEYHDGNSEQFGFDEEYVDESEQHDPHHSNNRDRDYHGDNRRGRGVQYQQHRRFRGRGNYRNNDGGHRRERDRDNNRGHFNKDYRNRDHRDERKNRGPRDDWDNNQRNRDYNDGFDRDRSRFGQNNASHRYERSRRT
eukprot:TRINITY_DN5115_c0_g1_i5.p1 TRINITY_DN5115_c0_g1~~TRINITY_DN5115_c0_g1_i5.p1  ORF type:complete len:973 (+),score=86.69 TRINITY_DN5115_c0_g1_i5:222-2921(+)